MKFAIGLSPLEYYNNDLNSFDNFCKHNDNLIEHWYCSPPWTWKFKKIKTTNYKVQKKFFKQQLNIINSNNQKFQLALNMKFKKFKALESLYIFIIAIVYKLLYEKYKKVDSIVCVGKSAKYLKIIFPYASFTYSFNNNLYKENPKNFKYYSTIVIGRKDIRNLSLMRDLKLKYKLNIELLLNCSCHSICNYNCFNGECEKLQDLLIRERGIDWCIAQQSVIPSELGLYPQGLISLYKLSTRPSSLDYMQEVLDIYSSQDYLSNLDYNYSSKKFWKYICATNALNKRLDDFKIDLNKILYIKSSLWSKELNKNVKVY